jgi:HSP20 family protein
MSFDLVPKSFWSFPNRLSNFIEENEDLNSFFHNSGLSISEDDNHVYVEGVVAGVDPKNVEVTFENGVLWVKGESASEEKGEKRKYYRKSNRSFSYHVTVPGEIDHHKDPDVVIKNGMLSATFDKKAPTEPKKLSVRVE